MASKRRLSKFRRFQLASRYARGEHPSALAQEFGVGRGYPALLALKFKLPKQIMRSDCPHCGAQFREERT